MLWFIFGKKRSEKEDAKEAEIQAIRQDTLETIKQTAESVEKVNKILDNDIVENIYLATGGDRRGKR